MSYLPAAPVTGGRDQAVPPGTARAVVGWGVAVGVATAALPAALFWLPPVTVYAVSVAVIAAVYIGFAVGDGRARVLAVETAVAAGFIVLAAVALADIDGALWLTAAGLFLHGVKDFWQHRTQFVANTRWWPPFCAAVDWTAAPIVAVLAVLN